MNDNTESRDNTESFAPSTQQRKAAGQLRAVAGGLQDLAAKGGQYTPVAQQAAERLNSAASWLEQREPAEMLREARDFARRRPAVVLAGAAAAALTIRRRPGMVLAGAAAAALAARRLARGTATGQPGSGTSQQDQPPAAIPAPPDPAWTPMPENPETPSASAGSAPYYPASGVPGPGAAGPAGPEPHGPEPYESGEQP